MIGNTSEGWGWPARTFHWGIAAMILAQFGLGLWMDDVPTRAERPYYESLHASIGISILALMVLRLAWRAMNVKPAPPPGTPAWQRTVARGVHWALYVVTFAAVLAGWMLAGSDDQPIPVRMFGLIDMPQLVSAASPLHDLLGEVHETLVFTLIALVVVHTAAALYHMAVLRDGVMRRMVSGAPG